MVETEYVERPYYIYCYAIPLFVLGQFSYYMLLLLLGPTTIHRADKIWLFDDQTKKERKKKKNIIPFYTDILGVHACICVHLCV